MIYPMVPFTVTLNLYFNSRSQGTRPINALDVLCAQLTRALFAIAKFLFTANNITQIRLSTMYFDSTGGAVALLSNYVAAVSNAVASAEFEFSEHILYYFYCRYFVCLCVCRREVISRPYTTVIYFNSFIAMAS